MATKLYEFSFLDKYDTTENDILRLIEQDLVTEAQVQNWAPGYTLSKDLEKTRHENGEVEYFFSVYGETLSSTGDNLNESDRELKPDQFESRPAAKPFDL